MKHGHKVELYFESSYGLNAYEVQAFLEKAINSVPKRQRRGIDVESLYCEEVEYVDE